MWVLGLLISASCTLQDCQILVGTILPHPAPDGGSGCTDGNHLCGDSCVANDVSACGDACTPCVASAHGTTNCDGTKCVAACDDGYLAEGDHCKIKFTQISASDRYACGVTSAGGVKCWGERFAFIRKSQVPIDVTGLESGVASVSVSPWDHQCAVMTDGKVKYWGQYTYGQIGSMQDASVSYQEAPVEVPGIVNARSVTTGTYHSCALLADSTITCWGGFGDKRIVRTNRISPPHSSRMAGYLCDQVPILHSLPSSKEARIQGLYRFCIASPSNRRLHPKAERSSESRRS